MRLRGAWRWHDVGTLVLKLGSRAEASLRGTTPPPCKKEKDMVGSHALCVSRAMDNELQKKGAKNDTRGTRTLNLCHRKATPYH